MVLLSHNFKDIFDVSSKAPSLSLPVFKENPLKIDFESSNFQINAIVYDRKEPPLPFAESEVFNANISHWRRLTANDEGCKVVYEVSFNTKDRSFQFQSGDTIGILPQNNALEVNYIISHLGLTTQADLTYNLSVDRSQKGAKIPAHVPVKSTLRHAFTHCVDIRGVIKKLFILALSRYTKDENERKVLEYLCSKEGSTTYTTHILNNNFCLLDVFEIFKSCKPPIEILLANLPRLLPRPYSIVNSPLKDSNVLKICFSVMDLGNNRKGLTTSWLEDIILNKDSSLENQVKNLSINNENNSLDCKIPIYLRKNMSRFCMPEDLEVPLLLIGPGTGVSPFIGFLENREIMKRDTEVKLGYVWLFFGCRSPKLDFIYKEEINGFVQNGVLDKFSTAFSRMEDYEIKYVQDALIQDGEDVVRCIKDGATIFVCGDVKTMAKQIRDILIKALVKYDGQSEENAGKYLSDLQTEGKYVVDVWS